MENIQVDADEGSQVGALFGVFGNSGNTYSVTDVKVTGTSEKAVSRLVGDPALGTSTFTMSGNDTVIGSTYAGEAVDYLAADTVLTKNEQTGDYGLDNTPSGQSYVAFNREKVTYYTALNAAFAAADSGDHILVVADETSGNATLSKNVTLESGSYNLPAITVAAGANLTVSGSGTLNSALTNNGTVTVDQDTTVTSYIGNGALATNLAEKRVRVSSNKLEVYDIPYVIDIGGTKYEDMSAAAEAMGATWDSDTLTLGRDVTVKYIELLSEATNFALDLNGFQFAQSQDAAANQKFVINNVDNITLTIQDTSAGQDGSLVAVKGYALFGDDKFVVKSGTVETKSNYIYYFNGYGASGTFLDIQGGTFVAAQRKNICMTGDNSRVSISGGTFNVLPNRAVIAADHTAVKAGDNYVVLATSELESGVSHGAAMVAEINGKYYTTLCAAVNAAVSGNVIEVVADHDESGWQQTNTALTGVTINGNDHTLTVTGFTPATLLNGLIASYGNNKINDLTIDLSDLTGSHTYHSAIVTQNGDVLDGVKVIGPEGDNYFYGVFANGSAAEDELITIQNCEFTNCWRGVSLEPNSGISSPLESLVVKDCIFTNCDYIILYAEDTTFTGNTLDSGKLNIMHSATSVTENKFVDGTRVQFYASPEAFEKNSFDATSYLEVDKTYDKDMVVDISENYWGGGAPSTTQVPDFIKESITGSDVYYKAETMQSSDLNTYVPPVSGSVSVDYIVSVDSTIGGKVTVSPGRADKGDTVTITVKPNDGYVLDTLTVTDKSGDSVKVTSKGDNKYTFTMPDSKVTVEATFVKDGEAVDPSALPFTDVKVGDYFYDAVDWAVANGVTAGTSATTFSPNASCTRAQTVTFLWRAAGSPEPKTTSNPFTDVKESDYYYKAVLWAVENSITAGTSATTFSPESVCTRGQVVTFLYRYDGTATAAGTGFADVSEGAYYYDAVQWAAQSGITTGTSATTFSPDANCTRGQIVTFLFRDLAE